jgi:uncharacterized protein involved in cysteine biosynthesis
MRTLGIILAAFGDIFGPRLGALALVCLALSAAIAVGAAWAGFAYLLPLLPDGEGVWRWLWGALSVLGGAAIVIVAIALTPAASAIIGGALFDVGAERIERCVFAGKPEGPGPPLPRALANGLRLAGPALLLNLLALPLLFVPVLNVVVFLALNGYLAGREHFVLVAQRHGLDWNAARAARRRQAGAVFAIGMAASLIPFVAPLYGAAAMTRLYYAGRQ